MSFDRFLHTITPHFTRSRILDQEIDLLAHGTDASFYRLTPKLVVKAETNEQVQQLILAASEEAVPLTFRTAGTSLSGQAVTDSVLVKLGHDWNGHTIEDNGKLISLQPGIIGSWANRLLKPHGRKIGPDPASIDSAMIGGIVANNASGMCCGTAQNTYQTLSGMKLILADGKMLDTRDKSSCDAFRKSHAKLLNSLEGIRNDILADSSLLAMIQKKYKIKNTCGYGLNSFADFSDPLEILLHLMVGSEGTLAFISEVTYHTVEDPQFTSCALVIFDDIHSACRAAVALKDSSVSAVELMDDQALHLMKGRPGVPDSILDGCVALLVDVRANEKTILNSHISETSNILESFDTIVSFTNDATSYADLWKIRKGLFPIVGAKREKGTTVIIEDICFPLDELADGTIQLQKLLKSHDYSEAVIFGHALEGNLHFVFTQSFNEISEVQRYDTFMKDLADLMCTQFSGSLKAEHGTGRNMAPFVEVEWGTKAYQLMLRVKESFDPKCILNPDVIISNKPTIHIENLKHIPAADDIVDTCIECGFCESVCPSRDVTLSPRQRIAVWREIQDKLHHGDDTHQLLKSFQYLGLDTCAGDGMCATQCPVGIDTGELVKKLRSEAKGATSQYLAQLAADHFGIVESGAKAGLKLANLSRKIIGTHRINDFPKPARSMSPTPAAKGRKEVVYFSSCIHRLFASESGKEQLDVITSLLDKLDYTPLFPQPSNNLCCGLSFESKGYPEAADEKMNQLSKALLDVSDNGRIPVICDNSPCSYQMIEKLNLTNLSIIDAPTFFASHLDQLQIAPSNDPTLIYSVCSQKKANESQALLKIAQACSTRVQETEGIACCGFGGDRGFSHPELNASALSTLSAQAEGCCSGYSSSRTCEIGLKHHSGLSFNSILQLLDQQSE